MHRDNKYWAMIIIFSSAYIDYSTDMVIDELDSLGYQWKRINGEDILLESFQDTVGLKSPIDEIDYSTVTAIWFRRTISYADLERTELLQESLPYELKRHYRSEFFKYYEYKYNQIISQCPPETFKLNDISLSLIHI